MGQLYHEDSVLSMGIFHDIIVEKERVMDKAEVRKDMTRVNRLLKALAANSVRKKNAQDSKKELELETKYAKVKAAITETGARERKIREKLLVISHRLFKETGIQKITSVLTATVSPTYIITDTDKAVKWCLDHNLAYLLTISDTDKVAELAINDPDQEFVTKEDRKGIRVASDLSKFL
jgi:hypothetical protein